MLSTPNALNWMTQETREISLFCISGFGNKPHFENIQEELAKLTLP
jgi:hypothetical protein